MKNGKNIIAVVCMAITLVTYTSANANNTTADEKAKVSNTINTLPETLLILDTPAPQAEKKSIGTNKQNAEQKAAIVGLKLKSQSTK